MYRWPEQTVIESAKRQVSFITSKKIKLFQKVLIRIHFHNLIDTISTVQSYHISNRVSPAMRIRRSNSFSPASAARPVPHRWRRRRIPPSIRRWPRYIPIPIPISSHLCSLPLNPITLYTHTTKSKDAILLLQ